MTGLIADVSCCVCQISAEGNRGDEDRDTHVSREYGKVKKQH